MYKAPLHIYVVWHPKFKLGQKFANEIYSSYSRNVHEPLSRGIGIPVFFRSEAYKDDLPRAINLKEAERNAILVLLDDQAVIHWRNYLETIVNQVDVENSSSLVFPVTISENGSRLGGIVGGVNFIRLHEVKGYKSKLAHLTSRFTHELCRMMYGKPRISQLSKSNRSAEPITLFISHAKKDGKLIAKEIKAQVDSNSAMQTFFDEVDIASGHRWKNELERGVEDSALLVVQTDAYSSREWCRWEVLRAKKNNRPVVVINAVKEGEERSFPYLGNVPTIRWKVTGNRRVLIDKILNFTLYEILRFTYTYALLSTRPRLMTITGHRTPSQKILASPPELLTLLEKANEEHTKGKVVLYPDPPLTAEELELLTETTEEMVYLTPTLLAAFEVTTLK